MIPVAVTFDRYSQMTSGMLAIANNVGAGLHPNGVAAVTGWLTNGIWLGCYVQPVTGWSACMSPVFTGWSLTVPSVSCFQRISFSVTPVSGSFVINFNGYSTTAITWNASAGDVQTALRLIPGLEHAGVNGAINSGAGLGILISQYFGVPPLFTISSNTLGVVVTPTIAIPASGPNSTTWTLI